MHECPFVCLTLFLKWFLQNQNHVETWSALYWDFVYDNSSLFIENNKTLVADGEMDPCL